MRSTKSVCRKGEPVFLGLFMFAIGCGGVVQNVTPSTAAPPIAPSEAPARVGAIKGVLRKAGSPVDGALVAAVPTNIESLDATTPLAVVTTSGGGKFSLANLPAGKYGVTATTQGAAATYRGDIVVDAGKTIELELELGSLGPSLSGIVVDENRTPVADAEIRAARVSNETGDVFYARADKNGAFVMSLPSAIYRVSMRSNGRRSDEQSVDLKGDRILDLQGHKVAPSGPAPQEVIDWMRMHALRLTTTEVGHGFDDLSQLRATIGDARIVSVGEATHGTHEFFQLKHRLFEYLATELGFTVFAIEANWPEALVIDDYVQTGKGDPQDALDGIHFWTWNTEEVLDLIRWMRHYNSDPHHIRKLHFFGFDMQNPTMAAERVKEYVRRVEPGLAKRAGAVLEPWSAASFNLQTYRFLPSETRKANSVALVDLVRQFDVAKPRWVGRDGEAAWTLARHHLRIIQECDEMNSSASSGVAEAVGSRDRAMAENVRWIFDHEPAGTRMMLWAHNGHVARGGTGMGAESLGSHLAKIFGSMMVVFGFAFDEGEFQAMPMKQGRVSGPLQTFSVPPAPPGSLDATLMSVGVPLFALDVRTAPVNGVVAEWLRLPHLSRSIGAVFDRAAPSRFFAATEVQAAFDVVLFVARTTAARPNHRFPGIAF